VSNVAPVFTTMLDQDQEEPVNLRKRMEGEADVTRSYDFEPLDMLPVWSGNEEARAHDFSAKNNSQKDTGDDRTLMPMIIDEDTEQMPDLQAKYQRTT